jgi:hypothetical protein
MTTPQQNAFPLGDSTSMAYRLTFTTAESPETVLSALREHAAYWKESYVPLELHRKGLFRVEAAFAGSRFRLFCRGGFRDWNWYEVRGTVLVVDGTTMVSAVAGLSQSAKWGPIALLPVAAGLWLRSQRGALLPLAIAAFLTTVHLVRHSAVSPGNNETTDHLVLRLRRAMNSVGAQEKT